MSSFIRVIGGWLDGSSMPWRWTSERAVRNSYRIARLDSGMVAIPAHWPEGREAQGIAMVRIFGPDESDWPDAFVEDFLLRKDKNRS